VIEIELKGLDRSKLSFSVFYVHVLLIVIFVAIQLVTSPKSRISIQGFHVNLPFGDIHSFGSYVVFLLFFFAALSVYRKSLLARLFVLVLLILTIASYSRTTWLAMLLVSCFMFLPYWRRPLFYLSTILFLLLVVNVAHYMLPESNSAYLSRFRSLVAIPDYLNAPEMKHRLIFWRAAASMVAEKPLLGSGVGTFYRLSKDYIAKEDLKGIPEVYPEDHPNENAHNFFLQFAAELGVVALILLIGILYLTVRKWISINKLPTTVNVGNLLYLDSSIECRGLCLGILAYLMTQVTGHALILPSHQFLFWYGIALLSRVTPLTNSGSVRASLPEHESFEGVRL
jgi:O-antigen ligase